MLSYTNFIVSVLSVKLILKAFSLILHEHIFITLLIVRTTETENSTLRRLLKIFLYRYFIKRTDEQLC